MQEMHKTVFIAYRASVCRYIAQAIFHDLWEYGYDVFMEPARQPAESLNLNQVAARAHFLLIMTPGTVVQCRQPDDWLRRVVEHAIDLGRNIITLLVDQFRFEEYPVCLSGKLRQLGRYSNMVVSRARLVIDIRTLRSRMLNRPIAVQLTPMPTEDLLPVQRKINQILSLPPPTLAEIMAEYYLEHALTRQAHDYQGQIDDYSEAIRLNPQYVQAYRSRARMREIVGDLNGALADYDALEQLVPDDGTVYMGRAKVRHLQEDLEAAIHDYSHAIRLQPENAKAYFSRATLYEACGSWQAALDDYQRYLALIGEYHNTEDVETSIELLLRRLDRE